MTVALRLFKLRVYIVIRLLAHIVKSSLSLPLPLSLTHLQPLFLLFSWPICILHLFLLCFSSYCNSLLFLSFSLAHSPTLSSNLSLFRLSVSVTVCAWAHHYLSTTLREILFSSFNTSLSLSLSLSLPHSLVYLLVLTGQFWIWVLVVWSQHRRITTSFSLCLS